VSGEVEICAGILLRDPASKFLLLLHADEGVWVQPGGHLKEGESLADGALRETEEETGFPGGEMRLVRTSESGNVRFTTFLADVPHFDPVLCDESLDSGWFSASELPGNTHPEVAKSIRLLVGTELDIAKAIRDGELDSPQQYENIWLFDVRVTGTGTSYRTALDEYVYRPPEDFLSADFLERCNGLPLIFVHPKDTLLNTEEYRQRAIGTVVLPYVKGDEVWGIAKVYDEDAANLMRTTHASTSPAVVFRNAEDTEKLEVDGKTLLIEGKPSYLDHLAICEEGVWDKGGEPKGVRSTQEETAMAVEEQVPAWADELGKRLDAACSRLDAIEAKGDSFEGLEKKVAGEGCDKEAAEKIAGKVAQEQKADMAECDEHKADAEVEASEKEDDKEKVEEKKDSEEKMDARADAQAKENADLRQRIADMDARFSRLVRPLSATDRDELARVQQRADTLAQMFGDSITPPLAGETPIEYRKRMAGKFQKHSSGTKGIKLDALDDTSFGVIEERIFADAQAAAMNPDKPLDGRLVAIKSTDGAGRTITKFHGDPKAWLGPFKARGMTVRIADAATRRGVN